MISTTKGDEIVFYNDTVLFEAGVFTADKSAGDIRHALVFDLFLGDFLELGGIGGSSIVSFTGTGDVDTFNIAMAIKSIRFECLGIRKDLIIHMQGTRRRNQYRPLANKVLIINDGESSVGGHSPDCESGCLETQGFAKEGVEKGICEH